MIGREKIIDKLLKDEKGYPKNKIKLARDCMDLQIQCLIDELLDHIDMLPEYNKQDDQTIVINKQDVLSIIEQIKLKETDSLTNFKNEFYYIAAYSTDS